MRAFLVVIALGACHVEEQRIVHDASPTALQLDITVGHDGVWVFTSGSDGTCNSQDVFPQPGGSTQWGDTYCGISCIHQLSMESGGHWATMPTLPPPYGFEADVTNDPTAVLVIEGCGGTASIPVGGHAPPTASATAIRASNTTLDVTWSGGPSARTAMLWFQFSLWADVRHVVDASYAFTPEFGDVTYIEGVRVDTFAGVIPVATDYGVVRVWPRATMFINSTSIHRPAE